MCIFIPLVLPYLHLRTDDMSECIISTIISLITQKTEIPCNLPMFNCPKFFARLFNPSRSAQPRRPPVHEGQLVHGLKYEWLRWFVAARLTNTRCTSIAMYNALHEIPKWMNDAHTVEMVHIRLGNLGGERAANQKKKKKRKRGRNVLKHQTTVTFVLFFDGDHCNSAWNVYVYDLNVQHDDDGNTRSAAQLSVSPTFEIRPQHFITFFFSVRSYFLLPTQYTTIPGALVRNKRCCQKRFSMLFRKILSCYWAENQDKHLYFQAHCISKAPSLSNIFINF